MIKVIDWIKSKNIMYFDRQIRLWNGMEWNGMEWNGMEWNERKGRQINKN